MKQRMVIVVTGLALVVALTGCGKQEEVVEEPVKTAEEIAAEQEMARQKEATAAPHSDRRLAQPVVDARSHRPPGHQPIPFPGA